MFAVTQRFAGASVAAAALLCQGALGGALAQPVPPPPDAAAAPQPGTQEPPAPDAAPSPPPGAAAAEPGSAPPAESAPQPPPSVPPQQPAPAPDPAAEPAPPPPAAAPPPPGPPPAPPPQRYEGQVEGDAELGYPSYAPPEEGGGDPGGGLGIPAFSIRFDPLNWLLEGRLGFELEVQIWQMLSFELVPIWVVNADPPVLDLSSFDDVLTQHGNGLGSLAGTSFGVGFWFSGEPFHGTVLRGIVTDYGYTFKAADSTGVFDRVNRVERRLVLFLGSARRLGFFTLGGGIGLGYELSGRERCNLRYSGGSIRSTPSGCGEQQIALTRSGRPYADLNGFIHPVYLEARLSLGITID